MRAILPAAIAVGLAAAAASGCGEERHSYVQNVGDDTPTMTTSDVSTFISDSGYTRYHITAPVWQMFEESKDPYWRFPDGLDLEQYDLAMQPEANIRSDSATYFSRRRLWRLDGNVVMVNVDGDSFLTQQLFWDQQKRNVYSDSFIHIVRTDRIIEGYGFTSNENMTAYTVRRPTGIIPVENRGERAAAADTAAAADSSATPAAGTKRRAPVRSSRREAAEAAPAAAGPANTQITTTNTVTPAKNTSR